MHASRSVLVKLTAVGVVAVAALTGAASASAATNWSVGISLPGVEVGLADPAPVYYQPAPVYAHPAPVYQPAPAYQPAPVYYRPAPPVVYAPAPVDYVPRYRDDERRGHRAGWGGDRHWERHGWDRREHAYREDRRGWNGRD
ncbi:hypothetical protein WKW82_38000 [Variovorax rhizosphaerae]|uniref:PXPV repeat-containing protein n=1 Tax=Variovorax rhizosphaerae TaxID=1836200 RepID=A0ABU8WY46_9BURK